MGGLICWEKCTRGREGREHDLAGKKLRSLSSFAVSIASMYLRELGSTTMKLNATKHEIQSLNFSLPTFALTTRYCLTYEFILKVCSVISAVAFFNTLLLSQIVVCDL